MECMDIKCEAPTVSTASFGLVVGEIPGECSPKVYRAVIINVRANESSSHVADVLSLVPMTIIGMNPLVSFRAEMPSVILVYMLVGISGPIHFDFCDCIPQY